MKIIKEEYLNRLKKAFNKNLLFDLLLLLPPAFLLLVILFSMTFTYGVSVLFVYFILPMFYTVDRRLRFDLNGIGKAHVTYADGYRDFFQSNKGGIFGVIPTLALCFGLFLFSFIILTFSSSNIVSCFPSAEPYYKELVRMLSDIAIAKPDILSYMMDFGYKMCQPFTIMIGLALFIPLFYVLFIGTDENLSYHYISGILFPDLDLNISAAQSRNVARTFSRSFTSYRLKESFKLNFPYYILFSLCYGLSLWGCSQITVYKTNAMMFVLFITPSASILIGTLLNHFCMLNHYVVIEENQEMLFLTMPAAMRTSIYQTFHSNEYIHGEESEARGSFIINVSPSMYEKEFVKEEKKKDISKGIMVDFSRDSSQEGKK